MPLSLSLQISSIRVTRDGMLSGPRLVSHHVWNMRNPKGWLKPPTRDYLLIGLVVLAYLLPFLWP